MTLSATPARQGKVGNCDCKKGQDRIVGRDRIVKKVDRTVKKVKIRL